MTGNFQSLSPEGLRRFVQLRTDAVSDVSSRFYSDYGSVYAPYGERGREACREDLDFHIEFLRPVLEFGLAAPMVDYLKWLGGVLSARDIPMEHLPQSLDWLAEFFASRMDAVDGAVVVEALTAVKAEFLNQEPYQSPIYAKLPPAWPDCAAFETALLTGDRRLAAGLVEEAVAQGHSLVEIELHIIQPALYGIGKLWQNNQVSVAQEHLATAIAQSVMMREFVRTELSPPNGKRILLACVEGNHHDVGLQMVADAFQLGGWEVYYLGGNVPTTSLVQYAEECKPDIIGLSVSFAQQLPAVRNTISRLSELLGDGRPPVIIGGLAINNFEALATQIGANAFSQDARGALLAAAGLIERDGDN